jgi:hypothetical protein
MTTTATRWRGGRRRPEGCSPANGRECAVQGIVPNLVPVRRLEGRTANLNSMTNTAGPARTTASIR